MITQLYKICRLSLKNFKLQHHVQRAALFSSKTDNLRQLNVTTSSSDMMSSSSSFSYSLGQTYHDFQCIRIENVPEFNMQTYMFRHNKTGSELLHIKRDDPNNVFSINFRTTPFDSSGLPHILEHTVLCGSKKFPVRDPFFKMLNRSVATYINASTGPDFTIYPFSTMNECDFRNLQKIYLDAVFKPNLDYLDFLQEGWRLEYSNNKDQNSDIQIKGVVYNEMKGVFSENSMIFIQQLLNSILPQTYSYVSGGNPLEIPKLTHEDLIEFHKKYYHPSNAKFFCYGNFNLDKTLSYINEEYLMNYERINNSYSRIPNHKRWIEPRNVHVSSRYDNIGAPFEKQNQIAITLLLSDITNIYETFLLNVISELLIKGPNSYFYKSLIEPNFSGGYSPVTGYSEQTKDTYFSVGLQDLKVDDFSRVQKSFETTINNAIENGFKDDHIESVLHSIELSLKHQTSKFGIGLLYNLSPLFNHDGDVIECLKCSLLIEKLRKNLKDNPKYLQQKIERYFKNNAHKLTLTMSPDEHYESKFQEAEQMLIKSKIANLTNEQKNKIFEDGLKLEESQNKPSNVELLPCLNMNDIKKSPEDYKLDIVRTKNHIPTQICTVDTNRVSYLKLLFDCGELNDEQIYLLPLFTSIITEMGTKNYDYREFDKIVTSKTSGINFNVHLAENIYDSKTYNLGILVSSYALENNVNVMFDLCNELFCNYKFNDEQRLQMLIENYMSNISTGIAQSGHTYAIQTSSGLVTDAAKLKSMLSGIDHIEYMKNLLSTKNCTQIMNDLIELGKKVFNTKKMRTALNVNDDLLPHLLNSYEEFTEKLKINLENNINNNDDSDNIGKFTEKQINLLKPSCQHFVMNVPVNYCAKSFLTVPLIHRDHPALNILSKLLTSKYLLPIVRERDGAYGAGAKIDSNGIFYFYSYRDPNSIKTLNTFDDSYKWLNNNFKSNTINDQTLFEAKLSVIQQLDMPESPGNKGVNFFLYGESQEIHNKYRERMLNVTLDELKKITEIYFKNKPKHYGKCILGPKNDKLIKIKNEKWSTIEGGGGNQP